LAAEVGFDGIEVMIDRPNDNRNATYLRHLSEKHNLPIVALHSPFVYRIPNWPADQLGRLEQTVALAQALGVPIVVTHLPYRVYGILYQWHGPRPRWGLLPVFWPRRGPYYHLLRHEERLAQMEAASNCTIAVENMPARRLLGVPLSLYWFNRVSELSRFPHLTLDTTHVGTWGADVLDIYGRLKERVAHVHLSNYDGREHRPPPDGWLALDVLLHRLAVDGFQGRPKTQGPVRPRWSAPSPFAGSIIPQSDSPQDLRGSHRHVHIPTVRLGHLSFSSFLSPLCDLASLRLCVSPCSFASEFLFLPNSHNIEYNSP
jgi:sugar phosphate isomerase/epimerase